MQLVSVETGTGHQLPAYLCEAHKGRTDFFFFSPKTSIAPEKKEYPNRVQVDPPNLRCVCEYVTCFMLRKSMRKKGNLRGWAAVGSRNASSKIRRHRIPFPPSLLLTCGVCMSQRRERSMVRKTNSPSSLSCSVWRSGGGMVGGDQV